MKLRHPIIIFRNHVLHARDLPKNRNITRAETISRTRSRTLFIPRRKNSRREASSIERLTPVTRKSSEKPACRARTVESRAKREKYIKPRRKSRHPRIERIDKILLPPSFIPSSPRISLNVTRILVGKTKPIEINSRINPRSLFPSFAPPYPVFENRPTSNLVEGNRRISLLRRNSISFRVSIRKNLSRLLSRMREQASSKFIQSLHTTPPTPLYPLLSWIKLLEFRIHRLTRLRPQPRRSSFSPLSRARCFLEWRGRGGLSR